MWTCDDWLLQGDYCPDEEIYTALETLRSALGVSRLVHLATDRTALLRSLTFAVPADSISTSVEAIVGKRQAEGSKTKLARDARHIAFDRRPAEATSAGLVEALKSELADGGLGDWPRCEVVSTGYKKASIRSILIVTSPTRRALRPKEEKQLASMINATPQAESRRDARWMEHSRSLPLSPDFATSDFAADLTRLAKGALELAANVTDASSAALYLTKATVPGRLFLRSQVFTEGVEDGWKYRAEVPLPSEMAEDRDEDIREVLELQRSIQRRIGRTLAPLRDGVPAEGAELLCPVPWTSASPDGPAAGLLVLHRFPGGRSFTAYNLALVRNVSLRMALHRNASAAGHIAAAVSTLRRGEFPLSRTPSVEIPGGALPSDVCVARERVEMSLPTLAEITDSHSVSLRLALPHRTAGTPFPLALVRVAAYPTHEMTRSEIVQLPDKGANWKVMRTGRAEVIGDVSLSENYTPYRDDTRSELSVPVRSEGRLIGTLNLESPFLHHYAALSPLVEAFAAAIGRTLADSVSDYGRKTLARALAVDSLVHDLEKSLETAAKTVQAEMGQRGAAGIRRAQQLLTRIRAHSDEPYDPELPIERVLRLAQSDADIVTFDLTANLDPEVRGVVCAPNQVESLRPALQSILVNIKDYSEVVAIGAEALEPSADCAIVDYDGSRHLVVCLNNQSDIDINLQVVADLYRVPVPGRRKPGQRIGAYLAGVRLKTIRGIIGASLHAARDDILRTVMLFPIVPRDEE